MIENKIMNPEVMFLFKDIQQTQVFIKKYITRVFFELETDVFKGLNNIFWKGIVDQFHQVFEKNIFDKISESLEYSKSIVNDIKALQLVENVMMEKTQIKHLESKYHIVLKKFNNEMYHFRKQFEVRLLYCHKSICFRC